MIKKLCIGLEVGKVSSMVKDMKKETQQMKKETKKPLSYAEAALRGVPSHFPHCKQECRSVEFNTYFLPSIRKTN